MTELTKANVYSASQDASFCDGIGAFISSELSVFNSTFKFVMKITGQQSL